MKNLLYHVHLTFYNPCQKNNTEVKTCLWQNANVCVYVCTFDLYYFYKSFYCNVHSYEFIQYICRSLTQQAFFDNCD
jgi:hypothetical protein